MEARDAVVGEMVLDERFRCLPDRLLPWFTRVRRDMPWRTSPTPYHVWISEIMLQQTRIEAVLGYYARFLEALPEIRDLAEAPEQQVMKLWEGLGYYSRAANLQKAAKVCCEQYGGELPDDPEKLRALPGIGAYTAGAIASIAFGIPEPAVDGNVLRVLTRLLADDSDIAKEKVKKTYEKLLRGVIPAEDPGAFNQALMELGETVCIPNGRPLCEACPLREDCLAAERGQQEDFPVKAAKKARRIETMTVLLVRCEDSYAIRRRPKKGLLAGLYELPWIPGYLSGEEMIRWMDERGICGSIRKLPEASHIFSHVEWHMKGWMLEIEEQASEPGWEYHTAREIREGYPIPTAMKKYDRYIR